LRELVVRYLREEGEMGGEKGKIKVAMDGNKSGDG